MLSNKEESLEFLDEAMKSVDSLRRLKDESADKSSQMKKLQKSLENDRKNVDDKISDTIKKRRNETTRPFDSKLSDIQSQIKKENSKREKARSTGMKTRIESETATLSAESHEMNTRIKTISARNGVPAYCNTKAFEFLSFPKGIKQYLLLALLFIVCIAVLPLLAYLIWGKGDPVYNINTGATLDSGSNILFLVLAFIIAIGVFGGLYYLLVLRVKKAHRDELIEINLIRAERAHKKDVIDKITRTIENDTDDSIYNLGEFDARIEELTGQQQEVDQERAAALNKFENETQYEITRQLQEENQPRLDAMVNEIEQLTRTVAQMEADINSSEAEISQKYRPILGDDMLKPAQIERIAGYLRSGQANTIEEAKDLYAAGAKLQEVPYEVKMH